MFENVRRQVPVRVNDANAAPGLDVLQNQVAEQRGFAGAGLPDDIDVLAAGGDINSERNFAAPFMPVPNEYLIIILFHPSRPPFREGHSPRGLHLSPASQCSANHF